METLLAALRAAAEPTRLRLLALAARGEFCVSDFTDILGQSQPRLSRHLRLLCDAGLLKRVREGANVWFALPAGEQRGLVRALLERLPEDDPVLAADRRQAARVLSERARAASESFRRQGADWDEMRALDLPAPAVKQALLALLPAVPFCYHFLFLAGMGATPGQAALGLRVVRDEDLGPPGALRALISTLVYYLTLAATGLLLLVALVTVRKRTLHDLVSGLVVVRARALTAPAGFWNMPGGPPAA
jgi:DNA-binding transcriptional ArsR family regulator